MYKITINIADVTEFFFIKSWSIISQIFLGGTFTVAGIIDSCIFTGLEIFKKFELGKLS